MKPINYITVLAITVFLGILFIADTFSQSKSEVKEVKMTYEVKKLTNSISHAMKNEVIVCLSYSHISDTTIIVDDYYIPKIYYTSPNTIFTKKCPSRYTIIWHTHPKSFSYNPVNGVKIYDDERDKKDMIYLSETDIKYTLKGDIEYAIVSSDKDNWAWWSREQIEMLDSTRVLDIMKPIKGQHFTGYD